MDYAPIWAAAAAFIVQALSLTELRLLPDRSRPNLKDWIYWCPFLISPLAGGLLAFAYVRSNIALSPILALNVGAAAPVIFRNWAKGRLDGGPGPFN
jgi:hypothetical protein